MHFQCMNFFARKSGRVNFLTSIKSLQHQQRGETFQPSPASHPLCKPQSFILVTFIFDQDHTAPFFLVSWMSSIFLSAFFLAANARVLFWRYCDTSLIGQFRKEGLLAPQLWQVILLSLSSSSLSAL